MSDLTIEITTHVQNGMWVPPPASPVVHTPQDGAGDDTAAEPTVALSLAGFNELSSTAMFMAAAMDPQRRVSQALIKRALDAYTSLHDERESTASRAAQYLTTESAAVQILAFQPLLAALIKTGY